MATYPNRQPALTRQATQTRRIQPSARSNQGTNWLLWGGLAIGLAAAVAVVVWRLQYQEQMQRTDNQVAALLVSADKLIQEDREDDAEAAARKGLALLPGDVRCQAALERIQTKREMVNKRKSTEAGFALAQAEQLAKTDIAAAGEAYDHIRLDKAFTPEAQKTAAERKKALQGGVCSLSLPANWPTDAILSIDGTTKEPTGNLVSGIEPGKHTIFLKRFGFRDSSVMEVKFVGLDPTPLPDFQWQPRGPKVTISSRPSGAAVWFKGKDLGKVTPCSVEDVDDGPIAFLLKHPSYAETRVEGEVKNRQPLKLIVTLEPLPAPAP